MKKLLIILTAGILLVILAIAGGLLWLQFYMQSPRFVERLQRSASEQMGTQVHLDSLSFNLLRGFDLKGFRVEDPTPNNAQNFLTLDQLHLRYSPVQLIRGKVVIHQLELQKPNIVIRLQADGSSNIPFLNKKKAETPPASVPATALPFDLTVKRFTLQQGNLDVINADSVALISLQNTSLGCDYETTPRGSIAQGDIQIQTIRIGSKISLTDCTSTLKLGDNKLALPNITGQSYQGTVSGAIESSFGPGEPSFKLNLKLKDGDVAALGREFGRTLDYIQGKLTVTTQIEGSQLQPRNLTGTGDFEIPNPTIEKFALFEDIATILQLPELNKVTFKHIKGNFKIENQKINFLTVEAVSDSLQMTAAGTYGFDGALNFDVGLAITDSLAAKIPSEIRDRLIKRDDGFHSLTFNVSGTSEAPRTNLTEKFTQAAIQAGLKKIEAELPDKMKGKAGNLLNNLFGGEKKSEPAAPAPSVPPQTNSPAPATP